MQQELSRPSAFGPRVRLSAAQRSPGRPRGAEDPPRPATPEAAGDTPEVVVSRGRRIYLRTFTRVDLAYLDAWAEDPHLDRMVGSEFLALYRAYERDCSFYDAVLNDPTQIVLMVMWKEQPGEPVGLVRLMNIHQAEGYAGIETIIADSRASRRGVGVQASRLMAYYGVDTLGLRRLEAKAYEYNPLSVNTLKRNGFAQEGVLRKAAYRDGQYWDIIVFGILKDEIAAQRSRDKYLLPGDGPEGNGLEPA